MQRKWKRRWQRLAQVILPVAASGLIFVSAYNPVYANPTGGTVTAGSAAIAANGTTTTISQTTDKASINWQNFNVAAGEKVQFVQPSASSVTLNRVVGNDASAIYGTLTANGKVYLINHNGILFAPGSQVNVGGLVASTLNISDSDFMNGKYTFRGTGTGSVVNQGNIEAANEAVFIGPKVNNGGVIAAKVTGLAAGNKVSLDFSGDSLLNITVDTQAADGTASNSGTITAAGGTVIMSAGTKDALLNTAVNNSGVIRAQSINNVNGVIRLDGGTVTNRGTLDASGKGAGQTGGTVKVLGDNVTLAQDSMINVSGDAGGGTALIGGAYQGGSSEYAATKTTVENGATINADVLTTGNGGNVVVWANDITRFAGNISAKGGAVSGSGGSVETSGHNTLKIADTASVTTTAAKGKNGSWLLDPVDVTIGTGGTITVSALQSALASSNVVIATGSSSATMTGSGTVSTNTGGNGDITVAEAVSWANTNSLTLLAYRNINVNAAIANTSTAGANVTLRADNTGTGTGTLSFSSGSVNTNGQVAIYYNPLSKVSTTIGGNSVTINSYDNKVDYSAYVKKADGTTANNPTAYMLINTVYDLQYIGTNSTTLSGVYALSKDIDASSTASWNSGAGFVPIGSYDFNTSSTQFSGSFDGGGHVIDGLTVYRPVMEFVGLFGATGGVASIRNVGMSNISVTGGSFVGGLVGINSGTISSSYASGSVSASEGSWGVGGLVGINDSGSSISRSYASGRVSGSMYVGGLVGINDFGSSISLGYASGNVSGDEYVGGLVGANKAVIDSSYASGRVSGTSFIGGLVGDNTGGHISSSYWDFDTTERSSGVGSLYCSGVTPVYSKTSGASAFAKSSYSWFDAGANSTDWYMIDGSTRPILKSEYSTTITNAHQLQLMAMDLTQNYTLAKNISMDELNNDADIWRTINTKDGSNSYGFVPIGDQSRQFTGTFDGLSHSISSLIINSDNSYVGLFGFVGSNGKISNVGLSDGSITGTSTGTGSNIYVGGLAGVNTGKITNSYSNGAVTTSGGNSSVGGLVGQNYGGTASITNCYSTGAVTAGDDFNSVGGLVGWNYDGTITNCYSTSAVTAGGYYSRVGGLVGWDGGAHQGPWSASVIYRVGESVLFNGILYYCKENNMNVNPASDTDVWVAITPGTSELVWSNIGNITNSSWDTSKKIVSGTVSGATAGDNVYVLVGTTNGSTTVNDSTGFFYIPLVASGFSSSNNILLSARNSTAGIYSSSYYSGTAITDLNMTASTLTLLGGTVSNSNLAAAANAAAISPLYSVNGNDITVSGNLLTVSGATYRPGGNVTTTGNQTYRGIVTLNTDSALRGDSVTFNSTVDIGSHTLSLVGNKISANGAITTSGTGRWLAYVPSVADISGNFLAGYDFTQYGSSYGSTVLSGSGNGLIYADALTFAPYLFGTVTKPYDGTKTVTNLTAANYKIDGPTGFAVSVISAPATGSYADKNVNSGGSLLLVTASGTPTISVQDSNNKPVYGFGFSTAAPSGNIGQITAAALTITASNASKTYGETATLSGYSVNGLFSSDSVSSANLSSLGTAATANKGDYAITASNASGTGLANYTITYNPGTLTVNPVILTIRANDVSKYFGSSNPVLSYNTSGLVNGDVLFDVIQGLSLTTTATSSSQPGAYTIHPAGDLISANYTVNWQNGILTVLDVPWQNQTYYGALVHADKMAERGYNQAMMPLVSTPMNYLPITIIQQGINLDGIMKFTLDSQQ